MTAPSKGLPKNILLLSQADFEGQSGPLSSSEVNRAFEDLGQDSGVVALDAVAAAILTELDFPYTTLDDWFDAAGLQTNDLHREALGLCSRRMDAWRAAGFPSSDLDPNLDDWELATWMKLLVARRFAATLMAANISRLDVWAEEDGADKALVSMLTELLSDRVVVRRRPPSGSGPGRSISRMLRQSPVGAAARQVRYRLISSRGERRAGRVARSSGRPLLLAALPRREFLRSRPALSAIIAAHSGGAVALPLAVSHTDVAESKALVDIPVIEPTLVLPDLMRQTHRFQRMISDSLLGLDLGELSDAHETVHHTFLAIAPRGVAQAEWRRGVMRSFERIQPDVVVTARVEDGDTRIIALARRSGAGVLTLPHGLLQWNSALFAEPPDGVVHLAGIVDPHVPSSAFTYWKGAFHVREYPHRAKPVVLSHTAPGILRVLALTSGFGNSFIRSYILCRRELDLAATTLFASHDFILKPHPTFEEIEPFFLPSRVSRARVIQVMPRDVDLHDLLRSADIVVSVGDGGSELVHAALLGLPIILLWATPPLERAATDPRSWGAFWVSRTFCATDADHLVELLQKIRTDPIYRDMLRDCSLAIGEELAPVQASRAIEDIIGEALGRRLKAKRSQSDPIP